MTRPQLPVCVRACVFVQACAQMPRATCRLGLHVLPPRRFFPGNMKIRRNCSLFFFFFSFFLPFLRVGLILRRRAPPLFPKYCFRTSRGCEKGFHLKFENWQEIKKKKKKKSNPPWPYSTSTGLRLISLPLLVPFTVDCAVKSCLTVEVPRRERVQVFIYDPGLEWSVFASLIPPLAHVKQKTKTSRFVSPLTSSVVSPAV